MSHPNPMHDPENVYPEDEIEVALELYKLDIFVHRYPDAARALVASLAHPTPVEQEIMDQEAARVKERLA